MLVWGKLSFLPCTRGFWISQGIRMLLSGMWLASSESQQLAAPPGEWRVVRRGQGGAGGWAAEPWECGRTPGPQADASAGLSRPVAGGLSRAGAEPVAAAPAWALLVASSPWLRGVQVRAWMIPVSYWGLYLWILRFHSFNLSPSPSLFLGHPLWTHIPGGEGVALVTNQPDDGGRGASLTRLRGPWVDAGSQARIAGSGQGTRGAYLSIKFSEHSLWCCIVVTSLNLLGEHVWYEQEFSKLVSSSHPWLSQALCVFVHVRLAASCAFPLARKANRQFRTPFPDT